MKHILATRPEHEKVVAYLSAYAGLILKIARQKGFPVTDLSHKKATQKNVESVIKKQKPGFLFFNGHGTETQIYGHEDEVLVESGRNEELLKGKITYALACKSAERLGEDCAKNETTSFIGYAEDFSFFMNKNRIATPLRDEYVKPIFLASNQLANSILKGNTVEEAYNRSQETFRQQIQRFKGSKEPEAPYIMQALVWNMFWQRALGDTGLSL